MKVSALGVQYQNYSSSISAAKRVRRGEVPTTETSSPQTTGLTTISFKSGNKGDVLHVVAECKPFNQKGGVATVVDDYKKLNNISATEKGKTVFVTPFYNGIVNYDANGIRQGVELPKVPNDVPDGHPLKKYAGKYVYVRNDLSKNTLLDATKSGDFWALEEVAEKNMTWGAEKEAPIKLLKIVSDKNGTPVTDEIFMLFSEATAYDPEPYSAGQYSSAKKVIKNSWLGDPYAKFDKATVEFMEDISKKVPGFDPETVVCSDSQAAYVSHFMAKKNTEGVEYFKGKKPMQIGHNLGDGYIGMTSARNMMINLDIYSPEELKKLMNTPGYIQALQEGSEAEEKYIIENLKVFENMAPINKLSAVSVAEHYAIKNYLARFGVVSQGYLDELVANPEIAPYIHEDMKVLKDKGIAIGVTNPLNDGYSAFKEVNLKGYREKVKLILSDGTEEVMEPMLHFTENDRDTLTLEQLKEYKRQNKINFLKRFLPKYDGAKAISGDSTTVIDNGADYIRAGLTGKEISIVQNIDIPKYISKIENGEDVNVIIGFGRGDFQKAHDEVIMAFKKYIELSGDKNALLVVGGDLAVDRVEGEKVKSLAELFSKDELLKGRIMLADGFVPGRPMARMADAAINPPRTAPCELTDFEEESELCTPVTCNGQGMKQKNFDPDIAEEADLADAYKTKHQYFDSREEILKSAKEQDKESFNKVYNKVTKDIKDMYKIKMERDITPELLEAELTKNEDYNTALRTLRDNVMTDELAQTLMRRFQHVDDDVALRIMQNQSHIETGWENNQKITRAKQPTAETYREVFRMDAKNIDKPEVIGTHIDKSGLTAEHKTINPPAPEKVESFWKSKGGKWTIAGIAVAVVAGIVAAIVKTQGNEPANSTRTATVPVPESSAGENLSAVV